MPRLRTVVLDQDLGSSRTAYRVLAWYDVPAARQRYYADANAKSAWLDAQPSDITALQNGSVVEETIHYEPEGNKSLAQIQADVASIWAARQAAIAVFNPWNRYGSTMDTSGVWNMVTGA